MRRDTVMIPPGGSVTLHWTADNPGVWFFREFCSALVGRLDETDTISRLTLTDCHIEWHLQVRPQPNLL